MRRAPLVLALLVLCVLLTILPAVSAKSYVIDGAKVST